MRRIALLVVFVALLAGAWIFRDRLIGMWQDLRAGDEPQEISAELATRAEEKLATMTGPEPPTRVALNSAEIQSLVAYRMSASLPAFILDPRVTVDDGELRVHARVPTSEVAGMQGIGGSDEIIAMLPDTTEVEARGRLIPLDDGRVALAVDEVTAASIPLPARVIPRILERIGRIDEADLPAEALALRLPAGVRSAYAHGDSVVFVSDGARPATD